MEMQVDHCKLTSESMNSGSCTIPHYLGSEVRSSKRRNTSHGILEDVNYEVCGSKIRSKKCTIPHHVNHEVCGSEMRKTSVGIPDDLNSEVCALKMRNNSRSISHHMNLERCASKLRKKSRRVPYDLMLNILSRVPARSLVRFRCACKLWNSVFHDLSFVRLQLNHVSKNPSTFLSYPYLDPEVVFIPFEIEAIKVIFGDKFSVPVEEAGYYRMSNACDGLIAFYRNNYAYVANPSTREWIALPKVSGHRYESLFMESRQTSFGLGFSTAIGKYKLVRIYCGGDGSSRLSCEVLTLGADRSWRQLGKIPYPVATKFEPAYSDGYIYWTVNDTDFILAFDISREEFVTIQHPRMHHLKSDTERQDLFMRVLEGSVCLVDLRVYYDRRRSCFMKSMYLHVLKGHQAGMWTKSYSLRLATAKVSRGRPPINDLFPVVIRNGKLLLFDDPNEGWKLYHLLSGAFQKMNIPEELNHIIYKQSPFTCPMSIVSIASA